MKVGIDIVDIKRIGILIKKYDSRFLNKVFTEKELKEWETRGKRLSYLAGRFATKEAFSKAVKVKGLHWKDVESLGIIPEIKLRNKKLKNAKLSISHTEKLATAVVVII
ncbi:MAG: holo-ACP synthase [bacterium]|nr:holo-ACP synthase [bacterium]